MEKCPLTWDKKLVNKIDSFHNSIQLEIEKMDEIAQHNIAKPLNDGVFPKKEVEIKILLKFKIAC